MAYPKSYPKLVYDWDEEAFFFGTEGETKYGFYYKLLKNEKYMVKFVDEKDWKEIDLQQFVELLRKVIFEVMAL